MIASAFSTPNLYFNIFKLGGGHSATLTWPKLGYMPHLLIDFDEMLYGILY